MTIRVLFQQLVGWHSAQSEEAVSNISQIERDSSYTLYQMLNLIDARINNWGK